MREGKTSDGGRLAGRVAELGMGVSESVANSFGDFLGVARKSFESKRKNQSRSENLCMVANERGGLMICPLAFRD